MNKKFIGGLLLGAVAGAALALFLTSDKGEELVEDLKDAADQAADDAKEQWGNLQGELGTLLKKGKTFVEDLEHKIKKASA